MSWIIVALVLAIYLPIRLWLYFRHDVGSIFTGFHRKKREDYEFV